MGDRPALSSEIITIIRSAMNQAVALASAEDKAKIEQLKTAILWADGLGDEFPARQPGEGAYWWRPELKRRAGINPQPEGGKSNAQD